MAYSQAWLERTDTAPCILAVIAVYDVTAGAEGVLYLSNTGYSTTNGTIFTGIIDGKIGFSESIDVLDGGSTFSFDDIEIINTNGTYDTWLDPTKYIWANRSIKLYLGDRTWITTDLAGIESQFSLIFNGVVADIDTKSRNSINLKIRNKMEFLDTPVTETKLGTYGVWGTGAQTNQDTVLPIIFGEVCNIEPLLVDPSTLQYRYNKVAAAELIEVRDNGVPVSVTVDATNYSFKLNQKPAGTITCSVRGSTTATNLTTGAATTSYTNNIANIIATIVTQYGGATKFAASDIDLVNLSAFATANTQSVGIQVTGSDSVISVCSELVASIGAQVVLSRAGKLQLIRPGSGLTSSAVNSITDTDIILNTLEPSRRYAAISSTKLGYCKNYTVQTGLLTGIPEAHKNLFAQEYLTTTALASGSTKTLYKLTDEPAQVNTCLISTSEAAAEAARRTNIFSTPRTLYKFTGTRKLLGLILGQSVNITHNRFGLTNKTVQVVSISPDYTKMIVDIEVLA